MSTMMIAMFSDVPACLPPFEMADCHFHADFTAEISALPRRPNLLPR
jgi:hypothetical protein